MFLLDIQMLQTYNNLISKYSIRNYYTITYLIHTTTARHTPGGIIHGIQALSGHIPISLGVYSFRGVKVALDCANGSSWNIAKAVFDALGAKTYVINAQPDGTNINNNAGSTHIEGLQKYVVENGRPSCCH